MAICRNPEPSDFLLTSIYRFKVYTVEGLPLNREPVVMYKWLVAEILNRVISFLLPYIVLKYTQWRGCH